MVRQAFHLATTGRPGPGAGRRPQGHRRPQEPPLGHGVVLAHRRRGGRQPARLPAHHQGPPQDDPPGGRADPAGPRGRSSTPAAASSRPGRPRRCASWPSCATSTSSPRSWPGAPSPTTTRCASACRACTATTPRSPSMQQSDLLIALGSRFDDRVTGKVDGFAPDAKIIHVDIDPAELGKVRRPDVPIVGDCRLVIEELVKAVRDLGERRRRVPDRAGVEARRSRGWQETLPAHLRAVRAGRAAQAAVRARAAARQHARRHDRRLGRRPAPDVDLASTGSSTTPTPG